MADECEDGGWLEYSSSSPNLQHNSFSLGIENQRDESQGDDIQCDDSDVGKLGKIREILKHSLCDSTEKIPLPSASSALEISNLSQIKGIHNHQIWLQLVSKLNSVRQPKWTGSSLEDCYHRCLRISLNTSQKGSSQTSMEEYPRNFFSFHDMNTLSSQLHNGNLSSGTDEGTSDDTIDLEEELVNKNELECNGTTRDMLKSDTSFEDIDPELEWSDNDVKDETTATISPKASGFDESEAAADLARLSLQEIIQLRNELQGYTKQYSDILVVELENRDGYIREKELKNDFISSFLAVQAKIREATSAQNKKKFSLQSGSSSNSQSLTTTIPYEMKNGGPEPDVLQKLIEIMEAMRIDSPNVPTLLTNYILKVLCK